MLKYLSSALILLPCRVRISTSRTFARSRPLMGTMEHAVVRCLPGEPKLTISFCLDGSHKHMLRDQGEALGKVLARISNGIAKGQGKAKKAKKNTGQQPSAPQDPPLVKLYHDGAEVDDMVLNSEAWKDGSVLQVGDVKYSVQRNPPTLTIAELPVSMLAGYPVCPKLAVEFGSLQDCEYSWYKERTSNMR